MLVYLVRHGQSYNTHPEPDRPTVNPPLTPVGQAQVKLLAERLGHLKVDRLLTSPMVRAVETANAISATTGRGVEVWFRCHEHRETAGVRLLGREGARRAFPRPHAPARLRAR